MPSTDDLLALQTALLAELIRESDSTSARLLRLYHAVYAKLSRDWLAILEEIEAERTKNPSNPTAALEALILRQERVRRLRLATAAQIAVYSREVQRLVRSDQAMAVEVGRIHAARLMQESARVTAPGVELSFAELPKRALEQLVGRFSNGEPLKQLFDEIAVDAARKAEDALFTSVATGQGPAVAARALKVQLGIPATRSMAVAHTEMLHAYRSANLAVFNENSDVVKAWRWNAHLGPRTCSACVALHGTVWPLSVQFFPGHVHCRCSPSPVTVSLEELGLRGRNPTAPQTGPEWFDEQAADVQRRVLGPRKYDLFRGGDLDLEDTVFVDYSDRWGIAYREGSIASSLAQHGVAKAWQRYEP